MIENAIKLPSSSAYINVPANTRYDGLTTWSILATVRNIVTNTGAVIIKGVAASNNRRLSFQIFGISPTVLQVVMDRATTDLDYRSNSFTTLANVPMVIAATVDTGGSAGDLVRFYRKTGNSALVLTGNATATNGSGAFQSDAGSAVPVLNNAASTNGSTLHLYNQIVVSNVRLTQKEIADFALNPFKKVRGTIYRSFLAANGRNKVIDISGFAGHGTLTNSAAPITAIYPSIDRSTDY